MVCVTPASHGGVGQARKDGLAPCVGSIREPAAFSMVKKEAYNSNEVSPKAEQGAALPVYASVCFCMAPRFAGKMTMH